MSRAVMANTAAKAGRGGQAIDGKGPCGRNRRPEGCNRKVTNCLDTAEVTTRGSPSPRMVATRRRTDRSGASARPLQVLELRTPA